MARPTKLTPEIQAQAEAYVLSPMTHGDPVPTTAGLAVALNVARSSLYKWAEEDEAFSDTLASLKDMQEKTLIAGGLSNQFNATIAKLMLHNHDYSDKQELTGKDGDPLFDDQAKEKGKGAVAAFVANNSRDTGKGK